MGVATTGVAGPDAQDGKPVGLVFIAVAIDSEAHAFEFRFEGDRASIRAQAVTAAISSLSQALSHR